MKDLKQKTLRGGVARLCSQAATFVIRLISLMILARLLDPRDFGLVGMVTAFTGILGIFRDFGLSSAAIQRPEISTEQSSTLFWINIGFGAVIAVLMALLSPAIAGFYHEPRLAAVTSVLALGFLFNAAGTQHSVLLQRQMRFTALAVIGVLSLAVSSAIAIAGAKMGYGYWALVAMTVAAPLTGTIAFWMATSWVPGLPRRQCGIRSMMRFGGTLTLNGLVAYIAYNLEKVLLGRFLGADAIGIYGRAYQLANIPTDNLNGAVGEVAFSALSRVQDDPVRFRNYFIKGYSLVVSLTVPLTILCGLFADDLILALLGPKWKSAAPIFRMLSPTILIFAIINPLGWLMFSLGHVARSLKIALIFAPLIIIGYVAGLPHGPMGVAFAYSAVMTLWVVPHVLLCIHGTVISFRDIALSVSRPLACGAVATIVVLVLRLAVGHLLSPLPRLFVESGVLLVVFFIMLLFAAGQKTFYLDLLRGLKETAPMEQDSLASA